jgi:hypothetical protein
MEFMLLFTDREGGSAGDAGAMAEMQQFADELARQGKLRRCAALNSEPGPARVRVRDGKALVSDGPFAETKELMGGFCIIEAESRDEAIEIARRCPHARRGRVDVVAVGGRHAGDDSSGGSPFLLAFHVSATPPDDLGSKMSEMADYMRTLTGERKCLESAPLRREPLPARVETRGGRVQVTDGPFIELKEVVGGYALVRAASRREAIELAIRCPHARWGPVEVREVAYLDAS